MFESPSAKGRMRPRARRVSRTRRVSTESLEARSLLSLVTIDFEGFTAASEWAGGTENGFEIAHIGGSEAALQDLAIPQLPLSNHRLISPAGPSFQSVYQVTKSDTSVFLFTSIDAGWVGSPAAGQQLTVTGYLGSTVQGTDVFQPENGPAQFTATSLASKIVDRLVLTLDSDPIGYATQIDNLVLEHDPRPNLADNGGPRFSAVGAGWLPSALGGFQGDSLYYPTGGTSAQTATWTFDVTPGTPYAVYVTYPAHPTSSTVAPFTILDGATVVGGEAINQRVAPNDLQIDGAFWEKVGGLVTPTSSTLTLRLTANGLDGVVRADAARIEAIQPVQIADDGDAAFQTIGTGWLSSGQGGHEGDSLFNLSNKANEAAIWTFHVTPGEWYHVYTTYPAHPTSSTVAPFTILDGVTVVGSEAINQRLAPDDLNADGTSWEQIGNRLFATTSTITVRLGANGIDGAVRADAIRIELAPPPTPTNIIDNGDSQFATVGDWRVSALGGYQGSSLFYNGKSPGGMAAWTFTVTPGTTYRVYTTYPAHATSSAAAPFTILDGVVVVGTEAIDQRIAPNDLFVNSWMWEQILSDVTVTSTTLTVQLGVASDGVVRADAIWLLPVGIPLDLMSFSTTRSLDSNDPYGMIGADLALAQLYGDSPDHGLTDPLDLFAHRRRDRNG